MDLMSYTPKAQFSQRNLLTLQDWTTDEILQTLSLAVKLKQHSARARARIRENAFFMGNSPFNNVDFHRSFPLQVLSHSYSLLSM